MTYLEKVQAETKQAARESNRGRKPMKEEDRKTTVHLFPTNKVVEKFGGKEALQKFIMAAIENELERRRNDI